jgi:predicted alpha/beta superfamily hydrolase
MIGSLPSTLTLKGALDSLCGALYIITNSLVAGERATLFRCVIFCAAVLPLQAAAVEVPGSKVDPQQILQRHVEAIGDPSYKPAQDALAALEPSASTQLKLQILPLHSRIFNNDRVLRILLPPGYDDATQAATRYPVLYLNDGQDLFDARDSTFHNGSWLLRERMEALYETGAIRPIIIVGIDNAGHSQRPNEYLPWPDDTLRPAMPHPHGSEYPQFVMNEVMPLVRSHFRTLNDAQDTGIGGASYGALVAIYVAAEEPGRFGKLLVESPSVYADNYHLITIVKRMTVVPGAVSIGVGTNEDGDPSCGPGHSAGEELQDVLRLRAAFVSASHGRSRVRLNVSTCATHTPTAWGARFPGAIAFLFGPKTDSSHAKS